MSDGDTEKLVQTYTHSQASWTNFLRSLKSDATAKVYKNAIVVFMRVTGAKTTDELLDPTDAAIEDRIKQLIDYHRGRGMSSPFIRMQLAAVKKFYKKNKRSKNLDWEDILDNVPKTKKKKDGAYDHLQVQRLLSMADMRDKVVILLMATAGLRIGALSDLQVKNLKPLDKYGIYKISVYDGHDEEYFTFCTPECRKAIEEYFDLRQRYGEKLGPESYLLRKDFDKNNPFEAPSPQKTTVSTLQTSVYRLLIEAGIRTKVTLLENNSRAGLRHSIKAMHGFRKFFDTQTTLSGISPLWVEVLEGHDIKLKESYFRPSEADLLEGNDKMVGYVGAINALTINEEHKLRMEVSKLSEQLQRGPTKAAMANMIDEMADMKKEMLKLKEDVRKAKGRAIVESLHLDVPTDIDKDNT